jgi:RNA-binding protein
MSEKLTGAQKKHIRGLAHGLKPLAQIGKGGLTEEAITHIGQVFHDHEIIKIRFNEFKEEKKDLAAEIARRTDSELVGLIGHVATFYREHDEGEKRTVLPGVLSAVRRKV